MQLHFISKQVKLTDSFREMAEKKLSKLDRYFTNDVTATVKITTYRGKMTSEITVPFDGILLRGEETANDMLTATEQVIGKLERQIRRHRTRLERRLKEGAFVAPAEPEEPVETELSEVVRVKRFPTKPLDTEEAALQMELLDHNFFAFVNAANGQINVLYRRNDGNLGLLTPDD